ncbi:MAG: hypothetical protein ABSA32_07510 [Candidatus Acidiferrales bacterium]|jgi:SpoU rRNA methylase family enzyme
MSADTPATQPSEHATEQAASSGAPTLHRVCIQCNNVFCVAPDHYDAKHCPTCRKE